MSAPLARRIALALSMSLSTAALAGALAGCSSSAADGEPAPAAAPFRAEILLSGSRVQPLRVGASVPPSATTGPAAAAAARHLVRWELFDDDGTQVASGTVPDPRVVRSEFGTGPSELVGRVGVATIDLPRAGVLEVLEPAGNGRWRAIGRTAVRAPEKPATTAGVSGQLAEPLLDASKDVLGAPQPLVQATATKTPVTLLVVPEGYREADLDQFHADARHLADELRSIRGYSDYWAGISVYMQDIRSRDAGVSDPSARVVKDTAFDITFGDDAARPRRCLMFDGAAEAKVMAAMQGIAASVKADAVVYLVNTTEYGGCSEPWNKLVTVSRNDAAVRIVAHELGHTLLGLADEYATPSYPCDAAKVNAPNASPKLDALPWKDLLTTSVLPTPDGAAAGTIGAFTGAAYCSSGVYRPTDSCLMRSLDADFCPVCMRELAKLFAGRGVAAAAAAGAAGSTASSSSSSSSGTSTSTPSPAACTYTCDAYKYAPGQCVQGWQCLTDGCIEENGCADGT